MKSFIETNKKVLLTKLKEIKENNDKLNACKRHKFDCKDRLYIGAKMKCVNCGAYMDAVEAFRYCQGYEAAGCNPNDIIEGFK